jgi:hypothetical protein
MMYSRWNTVCGLSVAFLAACASTNTDNTDNTDNKLKPKAPAVSQMTKDTAAPTADAGEASNTTVSTGMAAKPAAAKGCKTASSTVPCSDDPDPCGLHSGYPGDEYCLLPPPAGKGIQIHFGPNDYKDTAQIEKYLIKPGEEFNAYGIAHIPLTEDHFYNYVQIRMRPGSHHLINTVVQGDNLEEGFATTGRGCPGTTVSSFPGSQNLVLDIPAGGQQAPENVGIGNKITGSTSLCLNHHSYNFNESAQLREAWINVWFVDESEVTQRTSPITITAGPFTPVAAHSKQVLTQTVTINGTGRIISMFGHRHSHTDRFAVWHNDDLVYDSWRWEESTVFAYDTITKNPALDPTAKMDGATSGMLEVKPGDTIKIECDVDNNSDQPLAFKNELNTGEMCILFGSAVGLSIQGGMGAARVPGP